MQDPTATHACPRCAHENTADTRFCGNCGLQVDGLCPVCGTENPHSSRACSRCAHDFTSSLAQAPRQVSTGDLRGVPGASLPPSEPVGAPPPPPASGVACPRCQRVNEPGAAFCYNCGLPFDRASGFQERYLGGIRAFATASPGSFWMRAIAFIIDNLVIAGIYFFVAPIVIDETLADMFRDMAETGTQSRPSFLLDLALSIAYGALLVAYWSTTVGKKVFAMRVVRADGSRAGLGRALLREIARNVSLVVFPMAIASAFMMGLRADKRSLHDLIAGTVVVRR